jgi:orotate phosphoribosyltransferase
VSDELAALGRDLVTAAVLRGTFTLRSGATSSYYIDKYRFTTQPDLLRRLAAELARRVPDGTQRIAGTVLGAVPLAAALSLATDLPAVLVRAEQKEYGTGQAIEGELRPGDRVLLVEDVVTTGGAALGAVASLRAAGAEVLAALAVVDREEGGGEAFRQAGVPFQALFTRTSLGL